VGRHQKSLQRVMNELSSSDKISYFNFLQAAKRLNFRFLQADHLISLKSFFFERGGSIEKQLLVDALEISGSEAFDRV
jgi:hypothetical protein